MTLRSAGLSDPITSLDWGAEWNGTSFVAAVRHTGHDPEHHYISLVRPLPAWTAPNRTKLLQAAQSALRRVLYIPRPPPPHLGALSRLPPLSLPHNPYLPSSVVNGGYSFQKSSPH